MTRKGNDNYIQMSHFEFVVKQYLDKHCNRLLAVSDPVHLEIVDIPQGESTTHKALFLPNDERYVSVYLAKDPTMLL